MIPTGQFLLCWVSLFFFFIIQHVHTQPVITNTSITKSSPVRDTRVATSAGVHISVSFDYSVWEFCGNSLCFHLISSLNEELRTLFRLYLYNNQLTNHLY